MRVRNMIQLLRDRGQAHPEGVAYTFLDSGEQIGGTLSWSTLDCRSRAIGASIAARVGRGARVLIMLPPGIDFAPAFFGVLYAGAIAIPTYPPAGARADRISARVRGMVADAGVSLVLSCGTVSARMATLLAMIPELSGLPWLDVDRIDADAAGDWRDPVSAASAVALLQYTSGSTAAPRGVMVSHGNLLHNLDLSARLGGYSADSVSVSWLPVNHDMGLVNGVLQGVYSGCPTIQMAPAVFLQRPARWLQAISRFGATHSGAPNFAYDLCARRVSDDDRAGLDLGSWRVAYNGSEPVRRSTLERFLRVFGPCGFRWTAFRPGYGLAESTLVVTSDPIGTAPIFHAGGKWVSSGVSSGNGRDGLRIRIVDPVTLHVRADGEVGEIWVAGDSVALGYWNKPRESVATFRARIAGNIAASHEGPFLRTGDLGCISDGHLFVTGRLKDVLIIRGLKHYPHDLEATAEQTHPAVRAGGCAAFAVPCDGAECEGEERVAMAVEIEPRFLVSTKATGGTSIISAIHRAVADVHRLSLHAIALVPAGTLPRTTSGKLRRYLCRDEFLDGTLEIIAEWRALPTAEPIAS
jgi:acyl-CoA synthetase (AMP-forming)/AMP-acid ligase II